MNSTASVDGATCPCHVFNVSNQSCDFRCPEPQILSMQLPFAIIPLILFVSDRKKVGTFKINGPWMVVSWIAAVTIVALNVNLLLAMALGNG